MIPRCSICQARHTPQTPGVEPSEEGYLTPEQLDDAFRCGRKVCLACQGVWTSDAGPRCPDCYGPWATFSEDDLPAGNGEES
jgi:hypothetical protein